MATKRGNDDSPPLEEINFLNIHQRSLFHSEPDPFKSICTEKQRFVAFSKQMAKHVCNESQQLWSDIHLRKMNLVVDNYDAQKSINNDCDSISKMVKQSRRQTDAKKWKSSLSSVKLSMLDELPSPYNCEVSSAEKNLIKTLRNNAENQPPPPPPSKMDSHRKMDQTNNFTKPKMKGPQLDHRNEGDSFNNWNNRCSVSSGTNRSANSRSTMDIDGDYPNNTDRRWGSPAASFFENKHPSSSKHASSSWDTNHFSGRQNGDSNHFSGRQNGDSNHFSGRQNVSGYNSSSSHSNSIFKTATEELKIQNANKYGNSNGPHGGESSSSAYGNYQKKSLGGLGGRPRSVSSKFKPPIPTEENRNSEEVPLRGGNSEGRSDLLKCIDEKMIELIENEIMDSSSPITWDDIAGLEFAKKTIQEIVVLPFLRPDLFTGLRSPPKGILLFGPPGTGKTLIGKCIASESESTFFSISASSLTSKWIGDGEKMVRALFAVARSRQPSVIFIDEIDSLLSQRSDTEHESSRRMKTEFLVQLDGATTGDDDRILIIGATNRPQELDEAARRRLIKRLYIPLPDKLARFQIVSRLMMSERNSLTDEQIERISCLTDGYSGADMKCVCKEASLEPIRSIDISKIKHISALDVRPITIDDFLAAVSRVKSSVSSKDLDLYLDWDKQFGSGTAAR